MDVTRCTDLRVDTLWRESRVTVLAVDELGQKELFCNRFWRKKWVWGQISETCDI
ncbi:uncharacterized protein ASCRUDRAFT_76576, partial [Ascoidea rubescens DSM 1968]